MVNGLVDSRQLEERLNWLRSLSEEDRIFLSKYGEERFKQFKACQEFKAIGEAKKEKQIEETAKFNRERDIEETLSMLKNQKIGELLKPLAVKIEESRKLVNQKRTYLENTVHSIQAFASNKIAELASQTQTEVKELIDQKLLDFNEVVQVQNEIESLFDEVMEKLQKLSKKSSEA
jgi:succinate dehydrogenase flavin-adding protein (antitoxin of CptAB toxin-antitoxin module)